MRRLSVRRDVLLFFGYLFINVCFYILGLILISRFGTHTLRMWLSGFGVYTALAFITIYTLLFIIPFNPIPAAVVAYFGLISFGPFYATVYTIIADIFGVLINYYIARHFSQYFIHHFKSYLKESTPIKSGSTSRKSWWALMMSRVTPMTSGFSGADFPSYAAGIIGMPVWRFLTASITPWIFMDIVYFYGLDIFLRRRKFIIIFVILAIASLTLTIYNFYTSEKKKLKTA